MSERQSWTIDSALDGIDLDPEDFKLSLPLKKVPTGDVFEASRAGDVERLRYLLECGVNVNARDRWDSVALYYACLAGHLDVARMLLESGAICSEHTFDGDRCHYAALNLKVRKLLKAFEARPPPLGPLQAALRETFLSCTANKAFIQQPDSSSKISGFLSENAASNHFRPDIVFHVQGRPLEAHRVILSARSPFFKMKFETDWKDRSEVRFLKDRLSYAALYSLIHFFYSDRLEIKVDDMGDLVRICKVCRCEALQKILEKELLHLKCAEYKALRDIDNSQKRFILQASALPEKDRIPTSLWNILQNCLFNSTKFDNAWNYTDDLLFPAANWMAQLNDDLADLGIRVDGKIIRCHQVVLASRSEYFRARISHIKEFQEGKDSVDLKMIPCLEEHSLGKEVFEKIIEYMYTDGLREIDPSQAEDMLDAASRYLLFPMKRVIADVLLPYLETASHVEICQWLMLADMYDVSKLKEYCLDVIVSNFDAFAETHEFRAILLMLPPPSGEFSLRTTLPSGPGAVVNTGQGNVLDDLRERWLELEAAELDKRDESALLFDKRLEILMLIAEQEESFS